MFELTEKNIKNEITMSENLKNATNKINTYHEITKNAILGISMILTDICEYPKKYLENSQFSTIAEYAEEVFGYKKSYTYKLIKISKFIKIKSMKGEELNVSDLIEDKIGLDYEFKTITDSDGFEYSPSQMLELIPLTEEQFTENMGILDSSLTCKELRSIVKDIISPPIETTASEYTDSNSEENSEEKEQEIPLTDKERIMQMLEICSGIANEEIRLKLINVFKKSLKALEK